MLVFLPPVKYQCHQKQGNQREGQTTVSALKLYFYIKKNSCRQRKSENRYRIWVYNLFRFEGWNSFLSEIQITFPCRAALYFAKHRLLSWTREGGWCFSKLKGSNAICQEVPALCALQAFLSLHSLYFYSKVQTRPHRVDLWGLMH